MRAVVARYFRGSVFTTSEAVALAAATRQEALYGLGAKISFPPAMRHDLP